jgi:hypothetical protein
MPCPIGVLGQKQVSVIRQFESAEIRMRATRKLLRRAQREPIGLNTGAKGIGKGVSGEGLDGITIYCFA